MESKQMEILECKLKIASEVADAIDNAYIEGYQDGNIIGYDRCMQSNNVNVHDRHKPEREVVQYDAFINMTGDDVVGYADEHGDNYSGGQVMERRTSDSDLTVRVHLSDTATAEIAVRQLKRIISFIERDYKNSTGQTVLDIVKRDERESEPERKREVEHVIAALRWQENEGYEETQAAHKKIVERARAE